MATIRPYKNGFRTYISNLPVSRKPVSLERAAQQKYAMLDGGTADMIKGYSLGEDDIHKIIPTLKVISYPVLHNYSDIHDALDEKGRLLILYLTENQHTGHWVCLLKQKRRGKEYIEYFDPYGKLKPDQESKWLSKDQLREYGQDTKYLTELLKNAECTITYNKYPFQVHDSAITTCGRHCVCRLYFKHLSLPQYTKMIQNSGMSPDDFVSAFTYNLMGK